MIKTAGLPDFTINPPGQISMAFLSRNISTFQQACTYIQHMAYGRNASRTDLPGVFSDNCGTCSTKHALLKSLADENNFSGLRLVMGIYKMNGTNTPSVSATLKNHNIAYIPEAHCYLRYKDSILDFTKVSGFDFVNDLLEETDIVPEQIGSYKIDHHRRYLSTWLAGQHHFPYSLDELWEIREQCIRDLFTRN